MAEIAHGGPRMTERPVSLKITGLDWNVVFNPELMDMSQGWGFTEPEKQTITVAGDAPFQRQQLNLLHETIHAGARPLLDPDNDPTEAQVRVIAMVIYQVIRDNPELLKWLTSTEGEVKDE